MNAQQMRSRWQALRGEARRRWTRLTDDDLDMIGGRRETLIGRLQWRYLERRIEAEREVDGWSPRIR